MASKDSNTQGNQRPGDKSNGPPQGSAAVRTSRPTAIRGAWLSDVVEAVLANLKTYLTSYLWFIVAALVLYMLLLYGTNAANDSAAVKILIWGTIGILVITIVTRQVKEKADAIAVFRVGYGFAILVALGAIYALVGDYKPFTTGGVTVPIGGWEYERVIFGVVPGCDFAEEGSVLQNLLTNREQSRPAEIPDAAKYCGRLPPQWVLNIGGLVLECHIDGTCPRSSRKRVSDSEDTKTLAPKPACDSPLDCKQTLIRRIDELEVKKSEQQRKVRDAKRNKRIAELMRGSKSPSAFKKGLEDADQALTTEVKHLSAIESKLATLQDRLTRLTESQNIDNNIVPAMPIIGGVVVPVYFLALAIVGALVSMFRKLPEFQARSNKKYDDSIENEIMSGEKPRPPIDNSQVPEKVVFQMLQVLTAAPIAVLAYAFAEPANMATSIVLAFVAGFSSETILMAARGLVDKLVAEPRKGLRLKKVEKQYRDRLLEASSARKSVTLNGVVLGPLSRVRFRQDVGAIPAGSIGVIVAIGAADMTVRVPDINGSDEVTKPDEFFEPAETIKEGPVQFPDAVG